MADQPITAPVEEATQPINLDQQFADLLTGIKNNSGEQKYNSVEDALNSVAPAQSHISSIEDENKTLRDQLEEIRQDLATRKTVEEILATGTGDTPEPQAPGIDPNQLGDLVGRYVNQIETKKTFETNAEKFISDLRGKYGESSMDILNQISTDSGLTREELLELAAKKPLAARKLAGFDSRQSAPTRTSGSINTAGFQSGASTDAIPEFKSALVGASTQDLLAQWNRHRQIVEQKFGG